MDAADERQEKDGHERQHQEEGDCHLEVRPPVLVQRQQRRGDESCQPRQVKTSNSIAKPASDDDEEQECIERTETLRIQNQDGYRRDRIQYQCENHDLRRRTDLSGQR